MIYTPEMMRTLARQHDEDSDTRAALMQAADTIQRYENALKEYADRTNWAEREDNQYCFSDHFLTLNHEDGWEVAEKALKGE